MCWFVSFPTRDNDSIFCEYLYVSSALPDTDQYIGQFKRNYKTFLLKSYRMPFASQSTLYVCHPWKVLENLKSNTIQWHWPLASHIMSRPIFWKLGTQNVVLYGKSLTWNFNIFLGFSIIIISRAAKAHRFFDGCPTPPLLKIFDPPLWSYYIYISWCAKITLRFKILVISYTFEHYKWHFSNAYSLP